MHEPTAGAAGGPYNVPAPAPVTGDVFEFLDLPPIEHDVADAVAAAEHAELTLELSTVLQHDEHDPTVLGEQIDVDHELDGSDPVRLRTAADDRVASAD